MGGSITLKKDNAPDWRNQRISELERQLREAQATIAALEAQIVQLKQRIAESERAGKRQATPYEDWSVAPTVAVR